MLPTTPLQRKITNALNESRILILGAQILIGFQWHAIFEKGYEQLPLWAQYLGLSAVLLMLILLGLLIAPVCHHGIVYRGEDTPAILRFTNRTTELALIPFAVTLGIDLTLSSGTLLEPRTAIIVGLAGFGVALVFWFGIELLFRLHSHVLQAPPQQPEPTPLHVKIDHVLTEARMVLPGAQALLGFQFIIFFSESFQALPQTSKLLHFASLLLVCLAIVLLITPAAFHRIVEHGEDTERFYNVANTLVVAAMAPIAIASSLEFYIVVAKVTHRHGIAILASTLLGLYFLSFWFGYTLYLRMKPS
jgi:hypothetical protein